MKPRVTALLLTALLLLLVGIIPAARAQSAAPAHPARPERALNAPAGPTADVPAPTVETGPAIDALRLERHPNEKAMLDHRQAGAAPAVPETPALPEQNGPPSGYPYPPPEPEPGTAVVRASLDEMGQSVNSNSYNPDITPDGRYVAFYSYADNLVAGDWNEASDIFVRDLQANTIERVSVSSGGGEGNGDSYSPSISADGRYVVFLSYADNLVNNDENGSSDVFLHDRQTGVTTLISRHSDGTQGNYSAYDPVISDDGQFVAYNSYADNLVDVDENGWSSDIFVYDMTTEETILVSRHSDGTQGNSDSYGRAISSDGLFVAYSSYADNLVDVDDNNAYDIFIFNMTTNETTLVSRHSDGTQGNSDSYNPAISSDGRFVAYYSYADNLVVTDDNGNTPDIFVRDLSAGTTTLVSRHSDGTSGNGESRDPAISGNGRYVTFNSYADNLIDADVNGTVTDVFVHDLQTGATTLVSKSVTGVQGDFYSYSPSINGDGSIIAFTSEAYNLISVLGNGFSGGIFVRLTNQGNLHTISGRITDEFDSGLCCTMVRDISGAATYTDNDGNYTLAGLLPGDHGVWAWDEYDYILFPHTPIPVTLPPNATNIDIEGEQNEYHFDSFEAVADAYVDEAKKTANYGQQPYLRVKNTAKDINSYLKFEVEGLASCATIDYSQLQLFATNGGPDGGELYPTSNDWTETGINWNNAPALDYYIDWAGSVNANSFVYFYPGIEGNGVYSFGLHNNSKTQVQYESREGTYTPQLNVYWLQKQQWMPDAQFGMSYGSSLAPVTVQFNDYSSGCPTSWHWDFGDGATSNAPNPTHTFTVPGYYPVVLTVTNSEGVDKKTQWIDVSAPINRYYMSLSKKATVGGLTAEPADIVLYDKSANNWTMVYDGSVRGTNANIGSFAWDGDDLLIVFSGNQTLTGLGKATQYDVVRFTPNTPGVFPLGPGTFSWYFQGKPNGLSTGSEKIDALTISYGDPMLSVTGTASLPTNPVLKPADEDLFRWVPGWNYWIDSIDFDGSTVPGLAAEDINGVWFDNQTGDYYIVITGKFNLGGVAGNDASIVRLSWENGQYVPSLVDWLAPGAATFKGKIDAIELER